MEIENAYKRPYKMRAQGQDGLNTVVSIPPQVILREAEKRGISVEEFLERFRAIAHYNNFDGVFYAFESEESSSMAGASPKSDRK